MHVRSGARDLILRLLACERLPFQKAATGGLQTSRDAICFRGSAYLNRRSAATTSDATGRMAAVSTSSVVPTATPAVAEGDSASSPHPENYGFWQAAEVLFSKREAPNLVGRWDWHAWQLFVALLPPLAIFGIAKYGQWEMEQGEEQQKKKEAEDAAAAAAARLTSAATHAEAATTTSGPPANLVQRLDAVEATLRALQAHIEAKPSAGASSARGAKPAAQASGIAVPVEVPPAGTGGRPSTAGVAAPANVQQQSQQHRQQA